MTSTPGAWQALTRELAAWADDHKRAAFWWRDDDAARAGPRLTRLLDLSKSTGVPIGLAVVPAWLRSSLAGRIEQHDTVTILQHGWDHTDHARGHAGKGAWELGAHRGIPAVLADLQVGRDVLEDNFGPVPFETAAA